jgi:hypothetical protein
MISMLTIRKIGRSDFIYDVYEIGGTLYVLTNRDSMYSMFVYYRYVCVLLHLVKDNRIYLAILRVKCVMF